MSKTYRDKKRWLADRYYQSRPPEYEWFGPFRIFLGHNPKDINEPEWDKLHRYCCVDNYGNYKWWRTYTHKKYRRLTRKLIHLERYDDLPKKPENIDWRMC